MEQSFQKMASPQFAFEGGHLVMYHKEATGLPQVKDATVNDRDRMQDLLAQEKYLTAAYNVAMYEASHEGLHQVMKQNFDVCQKLQRQLFNAMFDKGWYRIPVADAQAMSTALQQFKQYQTQFPFPPRRQQAGAQETAPTAQAGGRQRSGRMAGPRAAGAGAHAGRTGGRAQLNQQVNQALQQIQQGRMPAGTQGQERPH